MGIVDAGMLHTEHGQFGIPARQCLELGQSGLDTRQGVERVRCELHALLGKDSPVEGVFGNIDSNKVAKVHVAV